MCMLADLEEVTDIQRCLGNKMGSVLYFHFHDIYI